MPSATKLTAMFLPAFLLAATSLAAEERCSGTLCDLYYRNQPAAPEAPKAKAAPTPIMVPSGGILGFFRGTPAQPAAPGQAPAAPAKRMIGVGGGGLAAMARGEAPERCSGTLCDFYYGGPPPEKPASPGAQPVSQPAAIAEAPADEESAPPPVRRYVAPEPPRCASAKDPWSCYR